MKRPDGIKYPEVCLFQHIVRLWTIERVETINAREGYQKIRIFTPEELLQYAEVN
ncbi:hypothetical protein ACYULU_06560 [Breznakiellaceae bacterium SP9]